MDASKTGLIQRLKTYWRKYREAEQEYRHSIAKIEDEMRKELKEEAIEFVIDKGEVVGIGEQNKTLVNREQLEK